MKTITQWMVILILLCYEPALVGASPISDRPDDQTITRWVNTALREDPYVQQSDIAVSTNDGIVTLFGNVDNLAAKRFADLEAKKIKGVRGVIDRIDVSASQRGHDEIYQAILDRLLNNSVLESKNFAASVIGGQVTLFGTVDSDVKKEEAALLASAVPGVNAVTNQIQVVDSAVRPDEEIRDDIRTRWAQDVYLAAAPIRASVTNGVATLEGTLANPHQISRAIAEAFAVSNVIDVRNKLTVQWLPDNSIRDSESSPSDIQLMRTIENLLTEDQRIEQPFQIHVQARDGHVILQGSAPTYHQRRLAGQDARDVVGVTWISDMLQVQLTSRSDGPIQADARLTIDTDSELNGNPISVLVHKGIVLLTGTVHSYFEKARAQDDAAQVTGVVDVLDNLDVNVNPQTSDETLKERVLRRLETNGTTWPVLDRITVTVRNGRATLDGRVDTWQQRAEAERVAILTNGVLAADNQLSVKGTDNEWDQWYGANSNGIVYDPNFNEDLILHPRQSDAP